VGAVLLAMGGTAFAAHGDAAKMDKNAAMSDMRQDSSMSGMPKWLDDLYFGGDFRLRYEYRRTNPDTGDSDSRGRARFRLRFWVKKYWMDKQMEVGFRLASGSSSSATSTNQTLTGTFSEKQIWIDRAYATYKPEWLKGLEITAGKFANPFVSTGLVWDSDVNPEGAYAAYSTKLDDAFKVFGAAGYMILSENGNYDDDVYLWAYQAGMAWDFMEGCNWTMAATWYDYDHESTPPLQSTDSFAMVNLTNKMKVQVMDFTVGGFFDWVHNCDENASDDQDYRDGFLADLYVGQNLKKAGGWKVGGQYGYIERDCTPGNLNDQDFIQGFGGTDAKGCVVYMAYNVTDFLTLKAKQFITETITTDREQCLTQVDLVWKF
jgi:hypothetical protein